MNPGNPRELARLAGEQLHRFPGGLRLRHHKKVSCSQPVASCPLPERLVVPLLQHRGEMARAVVEAGDLVLGGQLIGQDDANGAGVHAPTSGRVESIQDRPMGHPSARPGRCVVIVPDHEDRWTARHRLDNWQQTPPEELRRVIRVAGIVGLGGAVFPTGRKADHSAREAIHTLILNGAECEPYISCDEMLMREAPDRIVLGARMLLRATGAERCVIAIEDQMGAVRESLLDAVREQQVEAIGIKRVQTIYPEGGERQLIQVLTGLEVPAGGFPQDLGLLVQNVATAAAVADAVEQGRPLVDRIVTVSGRGVRSPRNLRAALGTPVADLIAACGGYTDDAARLVIGGPMMGYPLAGDDEPVVKATNCVLVLNHDDVAPPQDEMPCIRCGECARVCPASLMPQSLHFFLRSDQWEQAANWGLEACIECGCCDFVCPSHIPLTQWFRYGKDEVRHQRDERAFAEHSRRRYEAREARLAEQQAARKERLARRKSQLANRASRQAEVADAVARAKAARDEREPDA